MNEQEIKLKAALEEVARQRDFAQSRAMNLHAELAVALENIKEIEKPKLEAVKLSKET